jgi:hypothetical protein
MKIKTTVHVHYQKYPWEDEGTYQVFSCQLGDTSDRTYVGMQEIELDIPENYDPRPQQIAALKELQKKAASDYQIKVIEIQRRISELQALEYTA